MDKGERVEEKEKDNGTVTENMRARESAIECTELRDIDQSKEGTEREIQIEEINLMDLL